MFATAILFVSLCYNFASTIETYYVSPTGNCDKSNDCRSSDSKCSLLCPFFDMNMRLWNDEVFNIKMESGVYDLSVYQCLQPFNHLANISRNNILVTFEPIDPNSNVRVEGFPELPGSNESISSSGSILYIFGKHVRVEFHNFFMGKIYYEDSTEFGGYIFSTCDRPKIREIVFNNMFLQEASGVFQEVGPEPPFSMPNLTIESIVAKNTSFLDFDTPFYLKFTSFDNIRTFQLTIEDCTFQHVQEQYDYHPFPEPNNIDLFGLKSDAFVTIFSDENYSPPSSIIVNIHRTKVFGSNLKSVINLIDMGETDFTVNIDNCDFYDNVDLFGIIYLALASIDLTISETNIENNYGHDGKSIRSVLTIDELPLYIEEVYRVDDYNLTIDIHNSTIAGNGAYSILCFPFLEIFEMTIHLNLTDVRFVKNVCNTSYSRIPFRFSAIISFTQLMSSRAIFGGVSITNCDFIGNIGFNYVIYFLTAAGFLPHPGENVLIIDQSRFKYNQVNSSLLQYHPYGPDPQPQFVENSKILIKESEFEGNIADFIIHDLRDQFDYLTNHDFPIFVIFGCQFGHNQAISGGIIHATRVALTSIKGMRIISSNFYQNKALTGTIYASNLFVALNDVFVTENEARFGGGFFLENSVLTADSLPRREDLMMNYEKDEIHNPSNRIYNVSVLDNYAKASGGGLYCSECTNQVWLDPRVDRNSFLFMGNSYGRDHDSNEVLTSPSGMNMNRRKRNECLDKGGQLVWFCYISQIVLFDEYRTTITESTYEDYKILVKLYFRNGSVWNTLSVDTSSRFEEDYRLTLYSKKYGDVHNNDKIPIDIEFMGKSYHTELVFVVANSYYWLIPVTIVFFTLSLLLCIISCCIFTCCSVLVFLCFSIAFCSVRVARGISEEKQMNKHFERYPSLKLYRIICERNADSLNLEKRKKLKSSESSPLLALSPSINSDEKMIRTKRRTGHHHLPSHLSRKDSLSGSSFGSINALSDEFEDNHFNGILEDEEDGELDPPPERRAMPSVWEAIKLSSTHCFQGDPNSEGGYYYYGGKDYKKRGHLPVFQGFFYRGLKSGPGIEYFPPENLSKSSEVKFRGMFRRNVKHGMGKKFVSPSNREDFFEGEWKKGKLHRVTYNNKDLTIYDIKNDIEERALIYPSLNEDLESSPTRIYTGKVIKENDLYYDSDCVFKLFRLETQSGIKRTQFMRQMENLEKILKMLTLFDDENVVRIFGWSGTQWGVPPGYVMEQAAGNLISVLSGKTMISPRIKVYENLWKYQVLLDIAKACRFFHSCGIIHRDIKARNILIMTTGRAKLSDFELSVMSRSDWSLERNEEGAAGSCFHCAPEVLDEDTEFDSSCDVFSFGIFMYEILYDMLDDPYGFHENPRCRICKQSVSAEIPRIKRLLGRKNVPMELTYLEFMKRHLKKHGRKNRCLRPLDGIYSYEEKKEDDDDDLKKKKKMKEEEEEEEEEEEGENDEIQVQEEELEIGEKKEFEVIFDEENQTWYDRLMRRCWVEDRRRRPKFSDIVKILERQVEKEMKGLEEEEEEEDNEKYFDKKSKSSTARKIPRQVTYRGSI